MSEVQDPRLPIHGFVLAGGKSSRMGRDKALLAIHGRPMVEIAAETLRTFCAQVSIAGNREDLRGVAPVVPETREDTGPIAGIEAGLRAAVFPWALFVPVDVPLVPSTLLAGWAHAVLTRAGGGLRLSFLQVLGDRQPTFCLLHQSGADAVAAAIDHGTRKLEGVFHQVATQLGDGSIWVADAETFAPAQTDRQSLDLKVCFSNVNTPEELFAVEQASQPLSAGQ